MNSERESVERRIADAVAGLDERDGFLALDGGGRMLAYRPVAEDAGAGFRVIVLPPIDGLLDGRAPAIRPGEFAGNQEAATPELGWLSRDRRREVRRERHARMREIEGHSRRQRPPDEPAGPTSAPLEADRPPARVDAADAARGDHTRPGRGDVFVTP